MFKTAEVDDDDEVEVEEASKQEEVAKTDLELLEEEDNESMEMNDDDVNQREAAVFTADVDALIQSNTDEFQADFLRGAIPKVIYKHALKGTE